MMTRAGDLRSGSCGCVALVCLLCLVSCVLSRPHQNTTDQEPESKVGAGHGTESQQKPGEPSAEDELRGSPTSATSTMKDESSTLKKAQRAKLGQQLKSGGQRRQKSSASSVKLNKSDGPGVSSRPATPTQPAGAMTTSTPSTVDTSHIQSGDLLFVSDIIKPGFDAGQPLARKQADAAQMRRLLDDALGIRRDSLFGTNNQLGKWGVPKPNDKEDF